MFLRSSNATCLNCLTKIYLEFVRNVFLSYLRYYVTQENAFQHLTPLSETFGRLRPTFYFQIKTGTNTFLLFNVKKVIKIKCSVNARCSRICDNKILC